MCAYCGHPPPPHLQALLGGQEPLPTRNAPHLPDSTSGGKRSDSRPHLASCCLLGFVVWWEQDWSMWYVGV